VTCAGVLQGGHCVEGSRPSERGPAVGSTEGQVPAPVCDGVGVDDEWKHQSVREEESGCESV